MSKPVITPANEQAFPMAPQDPSDRFGAQITSISMLMGLKGLGCMMVVVEPGRRAFPFHSHLGNDEMFVILEGEGTYRLGDEEHPIKAGDICAAPRGGPDTAHQIVNTGSAPLKYLGISTSNDPDVVEFPDSGKFGALAIAPGQSFFDAHLMFFGRTEDKRDYWEGEDL